MAFLDENYLITNEAGKRIFSKIAAMPVYDAHNHANVAEIAANQPYRDLWQLLAATDHYVWEVMRKCTSVYLCSRIKIIKRWIAMSFSSMVAMPILLI